MSCSGHLQIKPSESWAHLLPSLIFSPAKELRAQLLLTGQGEKVAADQKARRQTDDQQVAAAATTYCESFRSRTPIALFMQVAAAC